MKESEIIDIHPIPVSEKTPLLKDNKVGSIQKTYNGKKKQRDGKKKQSDAFSNSAKQPDCEAIGAVCSCLCFIFLCLIYGSYQFFASYRHESVFTFELVCKSSFADKIHLDLSNITRHQDPNHLLSATAIYLLEVPGQYFSAETYFWTRSGFSSKWDKNYESLAIKATVEYVEMNEKEQADVRLQNNVHFVAVKLVAAANEIYKIPTIHNFEDVIRTLRVMKSIPPENVMVAELYFTHPIKHIRDVPSLNKITI